MSFRRRDYLVLNVVGRLTPGVGLERARAELAASWPHIIENSVPEQFAGQRRARFLARRLDVRSIARGASNLRQRLSMPLHILMGLVAIVLLVACVNMSNLLLARTVSRRHELAVRAALGANRWRLAYPLLTEGVLLSVAGALIGLPAAAWTSRGLAHMVWTGYVPLTLDPAPDWRVMTFTAALAIAAGVLFGLVPAWIVSRVGTADALGQSQRSIRGGRNRLGRILIGCQTALALALAITALQFVRTIHNLRSDDPGFDRRSVLVISLFPQTAHGRVPNRPVYYRQLAEEMTHIPGVEAASYSNIAPVSTTSGHRP